MTSKILERGNAQFFGVDFDFPSNEDTKKMSSTITSSEEIKNYVLDTNILLSSPEALYGFADNNVYLTATTLQELDSKKTCIGELGYNAREVIRMLDALRNKGSLISGVDLPDKGKFYVITSLSDKSDLPEGFDLSRADNRIIATILKACKDNKKRFILITNDISMRVNASICGVEVESYRNDHVREDEVYTGRAVVNVHPDVINLLYQNDICNIDDINYDGELVENEFFTLKAGSQSAKACYRNGCLNLIRNQKAMSVTPKNCAQNFALYALLAPVEEIPFVILQGPAGTSKTFLSLAAGLSQVYNGAKDKLYDKVLITRNNITSDAEFGYLPGDLDDKMGPLLAPFYDNLESLLRGNSEEAGEQIQTQIEDLFETGQIAVCPLAYMRGRSITNSYLIVDEAQNSTRSQMRDIVTRAGKGTKIVICGDPDQIDNHTLDKYNNGLVFASQSLKGSPLCAQITFSENECVRSALATEALKRMNL